MKAYILIKNVQISLHISLHIDIYDTRYETRKFVLEKSRIKKKFFGIES